MIIKFGTRRINKYKDTLTYISCIKLSFMLFVNRIHTFKYFSKANHRFYLEGLLCTLTLSKRITLSPKLN